MGLISPSTKPNGTPNWTTDLVTGAGLSADTNIIFNEFNGNIDNSNIKAGAGIDGAKMLAGSIFDAQIAPTAAIGITKIDDISATNAEQNTLANPGTTAANTLALSLDQEIEQLRYALRRSALGANARMGDGVSAGLAADGNAAWFDKTVIGQSVIANPAFLDATANGAANPPIGWTTLGAPTTLARVALDVVEGTGEAISIVDNGAGTSGISQTLAGLRASSLYLVVCRVKPVVGTFKVTTTGAAASFPNLAILSVSGGSVWQTISGVIATDAVPTNIVVNLVANAANAACQVCYFDCVPLGDDRIDRHVTWGTTRRSVTAVVATMRAQTQIALVVPGPGYRVVKSAVMQVSLGVNAPPQSADITAVIERSADAGATWQIVETSLAQFSNSVTGSWSGPLAVYASPGLLSAEIPGVTYLYRINALGNTIGGTGSSALNATAAHTLDIELKRA